MSVLLAGFPKKNKKRGMPLSLVLFCFFFVIKMMKYVSCEFDRLKKLVLNLASCVIFIEFCVLCDKPFARTLYDV